MKKTREQIIDSLTEQERNIWSFILGYLADTGFTPSYRQICEEFGWKSPRSGQLQVERLCELGLLKKEKIWHGGYRVTEVRE